MDGFLASEGLLKLASQCRFSRAMPSEYEDVFERYRKLYGPAPVTDPDDEFEAGDAADEFSEFSLMAERSRSMLENLNGSVLGLILECQHEIRQTLKDWRKPDWVIYPLDVLVMVILVARLCGYVTHDEVVSFYRRRYLELYALIDGMPGPEHRLSAVTVRRALTMLSAEEVNALLHNRFATVRTALLEMMTESGEQRERPEEASRYTLGFDGQECTDSFVRGETSRRRKCASSVTVFNCTLKKVISSKAVKKKNNEAGAFVRMLAGLDVRGTVIMADALNSGADVSAEIIRHRADYCLNIKRNAGNKELLSHLEGLFNRDFALGEKSEDIELSRCEKGHGRVDQWKIEVLPASKLDSRIKNPHKGTATLVRYTKTSVNIRNGKETKVTENTRYYVSSLDFSRGNATQILYSIMDYRAVEQHHARLDDERVFNQDSTQSCDFDYLSNVFGINRIAYNILSYIRQDKISKSQSKRHPSFSAVQDILDSKRLSHVFRYIARYYLESDGEPEQA